MKFSGALPLQDDKRLVLHLVSDQEEEVRKKELRDKAKKELDDWYKHHQEQLEKTKENNRWGSVTHTHRHTHRHTLYQGEQQVRQRHTHTLSTKTLRLICFCFFRVSDTHKTIGLTCFDSRASLALRQRAVHTFQYYPLSEVRGSYVEKFDRNFIFISDWKFFEKWVMSLS